MRTRTLGRSVAGLCALAGLLLGVPVVALAPHAAAAPRRPDSALGPGVSVPVGLVLESSNQQYQLVLEADGALELQNANLFSLWSTPRAVTNGTAHVELRPSGDLVTSLNDGRAVWSSGTPKRHSPLLVLQDDGNLVLRTASGPYWASNTGAASALPEGLRSAPHADQLIIVTAPNALSPHGWLTAWQRTAAGWVEEFGPFASTDGARGWLPAHERREGDDTTPEGTFGVGSTIFGNDANPGVKYQYHRLVPGDYWDENPQTGARYNTFQHSADTDCAHNPFGGNTECLWLETADYPYFVVIEFNMPARGDFGSGIFLHVTYGPSEGCVSVSKPHLVELLRWLTPKDHPLVVLAGPTPLRNY